MKFTVFQETRQGARQSNQDRMGYMHNKECLLMIVCDGMGGHLFGEVASQFVVEFMARAFRQAATPRLRDPALFLVRNIMAAHKALIAYAVTNNLQETPRTTCVASVLQGGRVWWANVGDSRLYLVRDGIVVERTVDHSHVQTLIDKGVLTTEQAALHPERNKIYNCIGQATPPLIDMRRSVALMPGDRLLLATDGLWGPVDPEFLAQTLCSRQLDVSVPMLMDLAETLSGRECDNLSTVALNWISEEGQIGDVIHEVFVPQKAEIHDTDLTVALGMIHRAIGARPRSRQKLATVS